MLTQRHPSTLQLPYNTGATSVPGALANVTINAPSNDFVIGTIATTGTPSARVHGLVKQNPPETIKKFIRYSLPKIVEEILMSK